MPVYVESINIAVAYLKHSRWRSKLGQVSHRRNRRADDHPLLLHQLLVLIPVERHAQVRVVAFFSYLDPPLGAGFCVRVACFRESALCFVPECTTTWKTTSTAASSALLLSRQACKRMLDAIAVFRRKMRAGRGVRGESLVWVITLPRKVFGVEVEN